MFNHFYLKRVNIVLMFQILRFAKGVELTTTWWLEIEGKINTTMLSPNTTYQAYLIVKFANRAYGLDSLPSEVCVVVGKSKYESHGTVYLRCQTNQKKCSWTRSRGSKGQERIPREREDGWVEIELGEFYNDGGGDEEVKMSLREVKGPHLKGGLVVEGIEIRPKE